VLRGGRVNLRILDVFILISYSIIPESSRWLLSRGREQEAEDILRQAGRINKKKLPEKLFDYEDVFEDEGCIPLWQLCINPRLLFRSVIIFFNW
jgi:OCT family organic cation transporter-like MFS transporter 4/5